MDQISKSACVLSPIRSSKIIYSCIKLQRVYPPRCQKTSWFSKFLFAIFINCKNLHLQELSYDNFKLWNFYVRKTETMLTQDYSDSSSHYRQTLDGMMWWWQSYHKTKMRTYRKWSNNLSGYPWFIESEYSPFNHVAMTTYLLPLLSRMTRACNSELLYMMSRDQRNQQSM